MPTTVRPGVRVAILGIAVAVSVVGAIIWSRTVAGDDVDAVLESPGEYAAPGVSTNPPLPTDQWPIVKLTAADGTPIELRTDGRPMVVNLWYSTCPPCTRELVDLASVHAAVGDDVRFVGVNPFDDGDTMRTFAADRGVTYELLRDPTRALADELAVVAFPVTVFVDADGGILERTGPLDADEVRQRLATYWSIA